MVISFTICSFTGMIFSTFYIGFLLVVKNPTTPLVILQLRASCPYLLHLVHRTFFRLLGLYTLCFDMTFPVAIEAFFDHSLVWVCWACLHSWMVLIFFCCHLFIVVYQETFRLISHFFQSLLLEVHWKITWTFLDELLFKYHIVQGLKLLIHMSYFHPSVQVGPQVGDELTWAFSFQWIIISELWSESIFSQPISLQKCFFLFGVIHCLLCCHPGVYSLCFSYQQCTQVHYPIISVPVSHLCKSFKPL